MVDDIEDDEEVGNPSRQSTLLWVCLFIIAGLIYILFGGKWGIQTYDTAHLDSALLILGAVLLESGWLFFKNRTPKVVMNGVPSHNTFFLDDFKRVEKWGLLRAGGTMAGAVYAKGREYTIVAPFDGFTNINNCMVVTPELKEVKLSVLPQNVRAYIIENKMPLPVKYGLFTKIQLKTPDIVRLKEEIDQLNQTVTVYERTLKKIMESNEGVLEWAKRLTGNDSVTKTLKNFVSDRTKPSEQ